MDDKQPDKLINESETKGEQNHQLQKIEKEMAGLQSSVSVIKTFMTQGKFAGPSDPEITQTATRTTSVKENLDEIRIRGIHESKNYFARGRQEHNFNEVQKVLENISVEAAISDVTLLGKYDTNKTRTILLKVPNPYQRRMILLSACKLQFFGRPV